MIPLFKRHKIFVLKIFSSFFVCVRVVSKQHFPPSRLLLPLKIEFSEWKCVVLCSIAPHHQHWMAECGGEKNNRKRHWQTSGAVGSPHHCQQLDYSLELLILLLSLPVRDEPLSPSNTFVVFRRDTRVLPPPTEKMQYNDQTVLHNSSKLLIDECPGSNGVE